MPASGGKIAVIGIGASSASGNFSSSSPEPLEDGHIEAFEASRTVVELLFWDRGDANMSTIKRII
jgi:hypothetical protein